MALWTGGPKIHRFTVSQLRRMRDGGILSPGARVELLDGLLVDMPKPSARELEVTARLVELLGERLDAVVVPNRPSHPEAYATFDATLMVHDWERLPLTAPYALHRFSVEEYRRLTEIGLLPPGKSCELLDGVLFEALGCRDDADLRRIAAIVRPHVPGAVVRTGEVVRLGPYSLLTIDVAVCGARADGYESSPPSGGDVHLAIDVSDGADLARGLRWPVYARWGVQTASLVDWAGGKVLAARDPAGTGFSDVCALHPGDVLTLLDVASSLDVGDLLGPRGRER